MGPLISKQHMDKVESFIDIGVNEGAKLLIDGRKLKIQGYENGYFVGPTLFDFVTEDMEIYKNEIFGPVLSVVRANNYESAINLINNHEYGNGTSIYTSDGELFQAFYDKYKNRNGRC